MRKGRIFILLGFVCLIIALFIVWQSLNSKEKGVTSVSNVAVIDEVYSLITEKSVYSIPQEKLIEGALRGMTNALEDPYSTYYTEKEAALHKQSLAGQRVGIGIEITEKNGRFIVVSPVKSSPAEKAGIRPFDEIVQVDDQRLDGKTMGELLNLIQGNAGEEVTLVIYRPSTDRHITVTLERMEIKNDTVESQVLEIEDVKIGYVSISLFGEKTANEWVEATNDLLAQDVKGIIVDLRDNPGGYLHSVAAVVSSVEREGEVFAYMQNGAGAMEPLHTAKLEVEQNYLDQMNKVPMIVLQNEGSASASEVMAGALQSWDRASIVGVKSFGKGTVQETMELQNKGELKLSTNKWLTPKRDWIHGKGINVDIEVEQHPLFLLEVIPLKGNFEEGDFSEEIAYVQKVLNGLGYKVTRTDGFYDKETGDAVALYRERSNLLEGRHMNEELFNSISEQVVAYKQEQSHDLQLQMGISVMVHTIKGNI
ncbi:S41 family peptidase [Ureibacillus acetophenoni]|uniref:Carboxyl-terminal processing protease n=1 Tax=Ureibacillus acetophenoni TaxID=614649 RepID=A0A285U0U6_9BACL|nr:S41 family peptidase [Ureibacillus acetophenoni]SOC35028.1 carboxyl-terminal processing protease [Ureibacillus acetophenoni]